MMEIVQVIFVRLKEMCSRDHMILTSSTVIATLVLIIHINCRHEAPGL